MSVSGNYAYIEYAIQSDFTTAVSAAAGTRQFGMDQKVSVSNRENMFALNDLYSDLRQKFAFGNLDGQFTVDWVLSNPWWIDTILGAASTSGSGPYTHTYDNSKDVRAFTAEVGVDTSTNRVLQLNRCVTRDITVSSAVGDLVKCRGNFMYGSTASTAGTSLDGSVASEGITTPYTFAAGAKLENPSGTALAEVQSMELTLNPNIRYVYEPNSAVAVNAYKGVLEITGRFSIAVKNNTWWNNVRARAEPSDNTLEFEFTNGLTSTNERTIRFVCTGLGLGEIDFSLDPNELVVENVPFIARDIQVVAVNNTSTPP